MVLDCSTIRTLHAERNAPPTKQPIKSRQCLLPSK
jgi:hypothetical protein